MSFRYLLIMPPTNKNDDKTREREKTSCEFFIAAIKHPHDYHIMLMFIYIIIIILLIFNEANNIDRVYSEVPVNNYRFLRILSVSNSIKRQ